MWLWLALACCGKEGPVTTGPALMEATDATRFLTGSWYVVGSDDPTRVTLDPGGTFALTAGDDGGGPFADMVAGGAWAGPWGANADSVWFDASVQRYTYPLTMLDGKLNIEVGGVQLRRP